MDGNVKENASSFKRTAEQSENKFHTKSVLKK